MPDMRVCTIGRHRRASGKVGSGVSFKALPLQPQDGERQADQGYMMVLAWPAASFMVIQSQFLFQLLTVLFHPPAEFSQSHQTPQRDFLRQVRKPILGGCFRRPLD